MSAASSGLILKSSAFNASCDLLRLGDLIALAISSLVGGFVLTSRSSDIGVISGGFSGSGLPRFSEKCSTQLWAVINFKLPV